jgi:UDP-2-acetamido-3-amino-2,3-dideoxy-glucuronate N-acetyltransferase
MQKRGDPLTGNFYVHPTSIVDPDVEIGAGTKIWHFCHVSSGASIGKNCVLGQNCYVGGDVVIGDRCKLQNNVSVYTRVTLEEGVFCGPSCVFTNDLTPRSLFPKGGATDWVPTLCRRGSTVGANATVICGVTLGEHSMVGAGAVVTRDVPDFGLVTGVPARLVGWVCACGRRLDLPLRSDEVIRETCAVCGLRYELTEDGLTRLDPVAD